MYRLNIVFPHFRKWAQSCCKRNRASPNYPPFRPMSELFSSTVEMLAAANLTYYRFETKPFCLVLRLSSKLVSANGWFGNKDHRRQGVWPHYSVIKVHMGSYTMISLNVKAHLQAWVFDPRWCWVFNKI